MHQNGLVPEQPIIVVAQRETAFAKFPHYLLRNAGYRSFAASHGYEALYLAQFYSRDLKVLITEASLPFLGGLELASQVERIKPDLKTILLMPSDAFSVSENLACVPKNSSPETILATVRSLLTPERRKACSIHRGGSAFETARVRATARG